MNQLVSFQNIVSMEGLSATFMHAFELRASVGELMASQMVFALKLVCTVLTSEEVVGGLVHCENDRWLSVFDG